MKVKGAKAVHYDSGPNMTPLVDVVMVILIFLMLAGSFGGTTHYLMSKAGIKAKGGEKTALPPGFVPDTDIDLHVENNPNGPGTGFVAHGTGIAPTGDSDKLASILAGKLKAYLDTGSSAEHLQIVLYPAKNVHYEYVVQVYEAALQAYQANSQAKFAKVAFATSE